MANETRTVEIKLHVFELACRGAALDQLDVAKYLECMVLRDADYIRTREFVEGAPSVHQKKEDVPAVHPKKEERRKARLAA